MKSTAFFLAALLASTVAGCATNRLSGEQRLALYSEHAGAPVNSFTFFGSIIGWTSLGDSAIAVKTKPSEEWLLSFYGRCPDIEYSPVITVTSQFNRVSAGFDKVVARNRSSIEIPCRIREIRPLDVKAIRSDEKSLREMPQPASGT